MFFDNYFSTFPLFEILARKQIYAAGTVRLDRFSKPPFSSDSEMKKKGRGCSEEVVSSNGSVTCVKWYDNKCVAEHFFLQHLVVVLHISLTSLTSKTVIVAPHRTYI